MTFSRRTLALSWAALSLIDICQGAIHESASSLPTLDFDFVIVGGGTAGNTVANRLTEDAGASVLVLEAGVSNEGVLDGIVPFLSFNMLVPGPFSWNFTTTPQPGLNNRAIFYPRGHILGGSSSVNQMFYTRGSSDDFDRFASITGDSGWSWNSIQPFIQRNEMWTPPADNHNTAGQFDPSVHSTTGINAVSLAGFPSPISSRVIATTQELSNEFPFNLDMNSGKPLGVGWLQATIKGAKRSSSATSYLGPQFISRPNLHVLINSRVTRILQSNSGLNSDTISFNTVEFAQSEGAPTTKVTARKEIILSAGTVGTPAILMNSGIGDPAALTSLGIAPLVNLPSVGKNVSDHPFLSNTWFVNSTDTTDDIGRNATLAGELLQQWNQTQTGPFVDAFGTHIAWLRLPKNATAFQGTPDPSAGPHAAHHELITANGLNFQAPPPTGHFLSIDTVVVSPVARGSVSLASNNPFDAPLIDPGILNSDFDMFNMRSAVKNAQLFLSAPAWQGYVLQPFGGLANVTTDDELDAYIRANAISTSHLVGSAAMSKVGAGYGVVDPDLKLKNAVGVRIIDASIMPFVPAAHTQAPTYFIAERGADLVKATWNLGSSGDGDGERHKKHKKGHHPDLL